MLKLICATLFVFLLSTTFGLSVVFAKVLKLTDNSYVDGVADIHNGQVVWQGYDGTDYEIFYWEGVTDEPCPLEKALSPKQLRELNIFRSFRDQIMIQTKPGRWLAEFYRNHSLEMTEIFSANPKISWLRRLVSKDHPRTSACICCRT